MRTISLFLAYYQITPPVDPTRPAEPPAAELKAVHYQAYDERDAIEEFARRFPEETLQQLFAEVWRQGDPIPEPEIETDPAATGASSADPVAAAAERPAFTLEEATGGRPAEPSDEELEPTHADAVDAGAAGNLVLEGSYPDPRGKNFESIKKEIRAVNLEAAIAAGRPDNLQALTKDGALVWTRRGGVQEAGLEL